MKNKNVTIYYTDELNEEFSTAKITPKIIDEKYTYIHKNEGLDNHQNLRKQ